MSDKNNVKKWREIRRQIRRASSHEERALWEKVLADFEKLMTKKQLEIVYAERDGGVVVN